MLEGTRSGALAVPAIRRLRGWGQVILPVLIVALLFGVVVGNRLSTYHGNPTGFVLFGSHFERVTHPPPGAVINSKYGYDGQFFYLQAKDPLLLHAATIAAFRRSRQPFRMQRVAYPALSYLVAGGRRSAIPWAMLGVNVAVVLLVTLGFAIYALRRGWGGWWALAIGLLPGLLVGTLRDLSDPLACAAVVGGLMLWQRRHRWWAAVLLALAALAREPMILAVVAVAADTGLRAWQARDQDGEGRRILKEAWPAVLVPVAVFVIWQAYAASRYGALLSSPGKAYLPPFVGVIDEVHHALRDPSLRNTLWDLAYLAVMMLGIVAALDLLRRKRSAPAIAATLFGLGLLVLVFGDPWSYTRLSAPMFAVLLLGGLEQRRPLALAACAAAALLGLVVPFAPWLAAG